MAMLTVPGSFRDPAGFLFLRGRKLYRQVNKVYKDHFESLMASGLYDVLTKQKLLIPHKEVCIPPADKKEAFKVLAPEIIPFISYPYEWSFSQLKDAALLTLAIQKKALDFGLSLKDCSAYNIQFLQGKPILIDLLSFEIYKKDQPWVAYKQFCQHFLVPLALMAYTDVRLNQLSHNFIDGIPLDLASSLLPVKTRLNLSLLVHIHVHAKAQQTFSKKNLEEVKAKHKFSLFSFRALIDSLETGIRKLSWQPQNTEWFDYYEKTHNYISESMEHKKSLVASFLVKMKPRGLWDFGANTGIFSSIASKQGIPTIAFDVDPACVELCYESVKQDKISNMLPLLLDLTNPSPSLGWSNEERMSLLDRGPTDMILALALVHHLAISNNVPFERIASFFNKLCSSLIIEFVPRSDSQVKKLLAMKEIAFPQYTKDCFEEAFSRYFKIVSSVKIRGSERFLYLMKKK